MEKVYFKSRDVILSKKGNNYFMDGDKLTKETYGEILNQKNVEDYRESDFDALIRKYTHNFINQKFTNIVVLFGAGASVTDNRWDPDQRGIAKSGVTVASIAEKVCSNLEKGTYDLYGNEVSVFTLNDIAQLSHYSDDILSKDDTNTDKLSANFNLEDFLSNLFSYEKFVSEDQKEKLLNTKNSILDTIIKATSYDFNKERFNHIKLLNILSSFTKPENKLNLVTTNYDTLIEEAAETMKWTIFDGFSFSETPKFDSTMFDWNLVKDVPNVKTNENIYKNDVVNLLKIHGSLTWFKSSDNSIIRKNKGSGDELPVMVFPSSDKYAKSYQEPYFDLFNKFQNLLQNPNTLLITIGFSFADNHIARMILNAIITNDSLAILVTDYNIESTIDNWMELERLMKDYYNVAFLGTTLHSGLTEYLGDNINEN
ncbi:SIR2 family protein [Convivina intestini]|uniref:SIR2 family protein n=1 Tax=Convivina intestini TaxID=1505726 RepID=UPI00200E8B5A|nr:SIR2 family protein [Convivina intestini]CAH1851586.1 hypothetical protein R078131_00291 [Convivina intestini]